MKKIENQEGVGIEKIIKKMSKKKLKKIALKYFSGLIQEVYKQIREINIYSRAKEKSNLYHLTLWGYNQLKKELQEEYIWDKSLDEDLKNAEEGKYNPKQSLIKKLIQK